MAEYEEAIRETVTQQLLVPDGADGYSFRHALLREAIYADLLPGERTRLHGALAELLADESRLAARPAPRPSWPTTTWPATTSPGALAASVQAGARGRAAGAPRPRRTGTTTRPWPCGTGSPTPRSAAAVSRGQLALTRPMARPPAATWSGPCTSSGRCEPASARQPTRRWLARVA